MIPAAWNNLRFSLVLPFICRHRGHKWTPWWGVLTDGDLHTVDHAFRGCLRCAAIENGPAGMLR